MQTILLAFVIAWNTLPASSPLCFCEVREVAQAFEQAKAVFVGEVTEIVEPGTSDENSALPNQLYVVNSESRNLGKVSLSDRKSMSCLISFFPSA